jgi:hypothetical protein
MSRDHGINIHHEFDATHVDDVRGLVAWCESRLEGPWNIVADSGARACRGDGRHVVILLCDHLEDITLARLTWSRDRAMFTPCKEIP